MKLTLTTPYGRTYFVDGKGQITYPGYETPSGQWRMLGLVRTQPFGTGFVPLAHITPAWLAAHPLTYKNGSPRYTVRDLDHGTTREWGNTKFHGVRTLATGAAT